MDPVPVTTSLINVKAPLLEIGDKGYYNISILMMRETSTHYKT